jgi:hypothetical protein
VTRIGLRGGAALTVGGCLTIAMLVLLLAAPGAQAAGPGWRFVKVTTAANPGGRVYDAAATSPDGRSAVYYGGDVPTGGNNPNTSLASTWVYDTTGWHPKCGTTVAGATVACGPGTRSALGMGTGPSGVVLFGGFANGFGNGPVDGDTWRWNGTTWARVCTTATCGLGARALPAMAGNGSKVVLYGGFRQTNNNGAAADDTWVFDGTKWTQLCGATPATSCGPGPRVGASLAWDGTHFVLFGGQSAIGDNTSPSADTWILTGTSWKKVCGAPGPACGPPARIIGAFAYARGDGKPTGAVLAEGGNLFSNDQQVLYRDAWFWNATDDTWTKLSAPWSGAPVVFGPNGDPPAGPDPLLGAAAALPAYCSVVYRASNVESTSPQLALKSNTYAAFARASTTPNHCFVAPPSSSSSATPTPTRTHTTTHHSAATGPILAATGTRHAGALLVIGLSLLLGGAASLYLGRPRRARRGAHSA